MKKILNLLLDVLFNRNYRAELISDEAKTILSKKENLAVVMKGIVDLESNPKQPTQIIINEKEYTLNVVSPT
jgi:hypothetical protein